MSYQLIPSYIVFYLYNHTPTKISNNDKKRHTCIINCFFKILFTEDDPRQLDVDSFIEEALRMKDFHHPNVLTLTGICFGMDDMPLVILPFMQHGDLLSYIRNEKNVS